MPGDKGEAKGDKPMNQPGGKAGEGKGKPDAAPQPGEGKAGGDPQEEQERRPGQSCSRWVRDRMPPRATASPWTPRASRPRQGASEAKDNAGGNMRSEAKGPGDNKDEGKAETKQNSPPPQGDASAQGESKPSTGNAAGDKSAQGESKPDAGAEARNATAKDIADLVKDLQSQDAKQREEAKRKLEQITKQGRDSQAREKAEQALDQTGQADGAAEDKPPQPGKGSSGEPMSEGKEGKGEGPKDAGTSKPGDGDKKQGDGDAKGQEGGQGTKGKQNATGEGKSGNTKGGNTPGGGNRRLATTTTEVAVIRRQHRTSHQSPARIAPPRCSSKISPRRSINKSSRTQASPRRRGRSTLRPSASNSRLPKNRVPTRRPRRNRQRNCRDRWSDDRTFAVGAEQRHAGSRPRPTTARLS